MGDIPGSVVSRTWPGDSGECCPLSVVQQGGSGPQSASTHSCQHHTFVLKNSQDKFITKYSTKIKYWQTSQSSQLNESIISITI